MSKTTKEIINYPFYQDCFTDNERKHLVDCFENSDYYMEYDGQRTYLMNSDDTVLCQMSEISQHYYKLPEPEDLQALEDEGWTKINGKLVPYKKKSQQARWKSGYYLEYCIQRGLHDCRVPFKGNPMNINHYARANDLVCDLHLEYELVEATNPYASTWMNNEIMLDKINYFKRVDKQHKKLWVIVTSFANFYKRTQQAIKDNNILVIVIGKRIHQRNYKRYKSILGKTLQEVNEQAKQLSPKTLTKQLLDYYNINLDNNTIKNGKTTIYVPSLYIDTFANNRCVAHFFEGFETDTGQSFDVAG